MFDENLFQIVNFDLTFVLNATLYFADRNQK
jgi:hypothetical protein